MNPLLKHQSILDKKRRILSKKEPCPDCGSKNVKRASDIELDPYRICRDCGTFFNIWALYEYPEEITTTRKRLKRRGREEEENGNE